MARTAEEIVVEHYIDRVKLLRQDLITSCKDFKTTSDIVRNNLLEVSLQDLHRTEMKLREALHFIHKEKENG